MAFYLSKWPNNRHHPRVYPYQVPMPGHLGLSPRLSVIPNNSLLDISWNSPQFMRDSLFGEYQAESSSTNPKHQATFEALPFSSGSSRQAFKGKVSLPLSKAGRSIVAKEFKSKSARQESHWKLDIQTKDKAAELSAKFNRDSGTDLPIHFVEMIPMRVTKHTPGILSTPFCNGRVGQWVVAEPYLHGEYTKWLSNNGWVNSNIGPAISLPAFSHWTWVKSGGELLVCDLQGVCYNSNEWLKKFPKGHYIADMIIDDRSKGHTWGYKLTDPAIHSPAQQYGATDRGNIGIHDFFRTHECNSFCRKLGIDTKRPDQAKLRPTGTKTQRSTSYSDASIKKMNQFIPKLDIIQE